MLTDCTTSIQKGEVVVVCGPSGSGKSTLIKTVNALEPFQKGDIVVDGISISDPKTDLPKLRSRVGMVFQHFELFPHLSVTENLTIAQIKVLGRTPDDAKARGLKMLDRVGLMAHKDKFPGQLSGGQQQRVALARALVFDPQLVLMDEPLGALDKQLREHMQLELKTLHRRLGVTFVYVTHDQSEALTMSDRVAVFNDGVIQQIDQVDRLYETPANRFVASFVGDNSVLDATVVQSHGEHCHVRLADGAQLSGVNVNQAQPGDKVQCSIRPERLAVADAHSGSGNRLQASINDVIYFGDHLRLRCEISGQPEISVKVPLQHLSQMAAGQSVTLHAPPQHLRISR